MAPTRLSAAEIAALDPYKFIAVIGKRVIHSGCRASMESLLRRAAITADTRVLDLAAGGHDGGVDRTPSRRPRHRGSTWRR